MALMDSASMRAWAGSYTPHGRSQCACTVRAGRSRTDNLDMTTPFADDSGARATLPRARRWRIGIGTLGAGAAVWARWRPFRVEVEGTSMAPDIAPGEGLVAIRTAPVLRGGVGFLRHPHPPG